MIRSASFPALGTTATLVVSGSADVSIALRLLADELDAIDRAASRFRPDSELARANAHAGDPIRVSRLFADALRVALAAAAATGGLVSPTLGEPIAAAGYDRTYRLVRQQAPVAFEARPPELDAWRRVQVEDDEVVVPPGVQLDLGATAKAFAADRAAASIADTLGTGVLVSLGGDISVAGAPPPGGWPVRIAEDHAAPLDAPGPVVAIAAGGLATSSIVIRRWLTTTGKAHHLFDPRTGAPSRSDWRTVTAAAGTCVDANVASTLAVIAGPAAGAWLDARCIPARIVRRDGSVVLLGTWPAAAEAA
ncbi:MAG TPA: FAD:protein FMN transferase [Gaiellaceae bacterium]|nr:FAD:protein FMN transferase [Gaiellaceae bacterium]